MSTTANPILETRNPDWGFFGTMQRADFDPKTAWRLAFDALLDAADAHDGYGPEGVRDWLDSRDGRHFADMVVDRHMASAGRISLKDCIASAAATYQRWSIGPRTEREHGIPRGLPYLTGWIQHYAITAEAEA